MGVLAGLTPLLQKTIFYCVEPIPTATPCGSEKQMQTKEVLEADWISGGLCQAPRTDDDFKDWRLWISANYSDVYSN